MGSVMPPAAISRNMFSKIFVAVLLSVCSAIPFKPYKDIPPLYPFNGGESFTPTPFAPANDQAWINMMWWKSLAGKPVESKMGLIDPYNKDAESWNQFLLAMLKDKSKLPGITPGAYQKWTQFSNPAAEYIGYGLFSNPLGHKGSLPPLGSTLFQPGNDQFWLMQFLQAQNRKPGGPISNDMLKQYSYLLNSQAPLSVDPYANYWAFKNSLSNEGPGPSSYGRKKRAAGEEEHDDDHDDEHEDEEDENDIVEAIVKASVKEDEEAAEAVAAQDAEDEGDEEDDEEDMTDDTYPDILTNLLRGGRSYAMSEADHEDEHDDTEVIDYRDWYDNVYLPWYANWEREMMEYKLKMLKYEAAHYQVSNPFGDVTFGNPYPFYSKAAYMQSLFDDVDGSKGPKVKYATEYQDWKDSL